MMKKALISALLMLGLAACTGDARKDEGAGKASGEVLPGSVSDAMIPLDQVKSQAPLAPKSEGGDPKKAAASDKAESAVDAQPADEVDEPPAKAPAAAGE